MKEVILQEFAKVQANFIEQLIIIADKHGIDRDEFLSDVAEILSTAIILSSFKNYQTKEELLRLKS